MINAHSQESWIENALFCNDLLFVAFMRCIDTCIIFCITDFTNSRTN